MPAVSNDFLAVASTPLFWIFRIMTDPEQIAALAADLQRVIDRYRAEFNLTLAAAIGTLEVVKLELWKEQTNDQD